MARVFSVLLALFLVVFISQVDAAPLESRQIGNLKCNVARLRIVSALRATNQKAKKISEADPATAAAKSTVLSSLATASDGIKTIAGALLSGKAAPPEARDQVKTGLLGAQQALNSMNGTDPNITAASSKLTDAINAGQDVVANCN